MPDTLVIPEFALAATGRYPLRTRPAALDPDTVGADLPISTLLASDAGWDWILTHRDTVDTAVAAFAAAVLDHSGTAGDLWLTAHLAAGFTLATRGRPAHGVLDVALFELD
jgi:hypothetical protein